MDRDVNRAVVYADPGNSRRTEVLELPVPEPGTGEVLIRLSHSGVCHTDLGFCLNQFDGLTPPTPKNQVGGHEGIGVIVKHGPSVSSPAIGARVGISYAADACLNCAHCMQGGETSCLSSKVSGYFTPGTFQQYAVRPARYMIPIPEGISSEAAAPLMCSGLSVYAALKRVDLRPGAWVLVCGAGGGLGHMAIQYAKAMSGRVIALDIGSKAQFCRDLGADVFVDFTEFSDAGLLTGEIKRVTGGGASVVLMCTSSGKAYTQCMSWLGFRGTLVCLGIPHEDPFAPRVLDMIGAEQRIIATKAGNRFEAQECLAIAAQGRIKVETEIRKMDELTAVFEELEAGAIQGRAVLDLS